MKTILLNRKLWAWVLLVGFAVTSAGCSSSMQRKFVRKKKQPAHTASVIPLQEGPYQKKYSNSYYYKTHYTFWRSWHGELIDNLGGNQKKVERCGQESVGHLTEISKYLMPDQKAALEEHLRELEKIVARLGSGTYSSEEGRIRVDLERIKRLVSNDFYYDKVKEFVLPDVVDLGAPAEEPVSS